MFKIFEKAHGEDQDIVSIKTSNLATKEDIANVRTEMIKWVFFCCMCQIAVTVGFIILYLKK